MLLRQHTVTFTAICFVLALFVNVRLHPMSGLHPMKLLTCNDDMVQQSASSNRLVQITLKRCQAIMCLGHAVAAAAAPPCALLQTLMPASCSPAPLVAREGLRHVWTLLGEAALLLAAPAPVELAVTTQKGVAVVSLAQLSSSKHDCLQQQQHTYSNGGVTTLTELYS